MNNALKHGVLPEPANFGYPDSLTGIARDLFRAVGDCGSDVQLVECNRKIWGAFGAKLLGADEADYLCRYVALRRPTRGLVAELGVTLSAVGRRLQSRIRTRQHPRSPDRQASRDRRRTWGASGVLPHQFRPRYPLGQQAVLAVIAHAIKREGTCDWPVGKIAALAGVCRTTVQSAIHEARRLGHLVVTERPQRGRKSLTNIINIVSAAWRAWLRLSDVRQSGRGSNSANLASPTKREESLATSTATVESPQVGFGGRRWRRPWPIAKVGSVAT